jgi:hypothetical protein
MPFVKCSVGGCNRKLQPILKVDPKDWETWFYPECDVCFRPVCGKHSMEMEGQIVCDECRMTRERQQTSQLIDLGIRLDRRQGQYSSPGEV